MRKYTPLALVGLVLFSCKKENVPQPAPEQPVTKTVTFHVFAGRDYSNDYFSNVKADVVLQLHTVDRSTGATALVWDTTFTPRSIYLFPQQAQMYDIQKSFLLYENKHKLNAGYGIKYNTDGMLQQEGYGEDLPKGQKTLLVEAVL